MIEHVLNILLYSDISYLFYWFLSIAFGGYLFLTGGSFLYFYVLRKHAWLRAKIQEEAPSKKQIIHELLWSLSSTLIWIVFAAVVIVGVDAGVFKLYFTIEEYGRPYFVFSVLFLIVSHDAYFYWAHRFMHSSYRIYKIFHHVHHQSKNPTPFSIHSFAPPEAVLLGLYIPLVLLILPINTLALLMWFTFEAVTNLVGHLGYELFPRSFRNSFWGRIIGSSTHHNLHHQDMRYGFGHYSTFWDRAMGTNHKDYDEIYSK